MSHYFRIVRNLHSGGSIGIGITENGKPFYCEDIKNCVTFHDKASAKRYLRFCEKTLTKYEGQKDLEVIEIKTP